MAERIISWSIEERVERNGVVVGGVVTVTLDGPRPRGTLPAFHFYPPEYTGIRYIAVGTNRTIEYLTAVLELMEHRGDIYNRNTAYLLQEMRNYLLLAYQECILNKLKAQLDRINNRGMIDPKYLEMLATTVGLLMSELNSYPNAPSDGSCTTQINTEKDLAELDRLIGVFAKVHPFFPEMLEGPLQV